jgi:MFS family permease
MVGFTIVWIGQIISLLGTSMTGFAMTIWAYEKTNAATALALIGFFFVAPMLIASPFAGALVDRSNRKLMMMVSDVASGITTIVILILFTSGHLQIWHLFITSAIQGVFQAFQWPAYSAAISTMIPKEHYGRANGMMSLAESGSNIFAPILAGALLGIIGFSGILIIDIVTFVIAVGALLFIFVPQPKITVEGSQAKGSLLKEATFGFKYILKRPPLLALQLMFMSGNFLIGVPIAVAAAMILANTGNNAKALAFVNSAGAVGGVVGGLVMSAWGGPKRRVHGAFSHRGATYRFWVTDPEITRAYLATKDGEYPIGDCYLTVSLGEPYEGYCYKLIAAVITPEGGRSRRL